MGAIGWIVLAVVIIAALIVLGGWIGLRRRRLQSRFGPEYQRVATESGSKWKADSELAARQQRRRQLDIRPISPEARDRYAATWQSVQAEFVDHPYPAVARSDELVQTVMRDRGYPIHDFEENAANLSVDHPNLVENYRGAHAIATKEKSANTEELRTAMLHYRALFQELVGQPEDGQHHAEKVVEEPPPGVREEPSPAVRERRP